MRNIILSVTRKSLEAKYGKVWSAAELDREFVVTAIIAPHVVVRRKADNVIGTLQFAGDFYFDWRPQNQDDANNKQEEIEMPRAKFQLGQVVATPGALEALQESGQSPDFFLRKHITGDWGIVDREDWAANDQALVDGSRLLSAYRTLKGKKLWIITEADRSSTCVLRPDEY